MKITTDFRQGLEWYTVAGKRLVLFCGTGDWSEPVQAIIKAPFDKTGIAESLAAGLRKVLVFSLGWQ